MSYKTNPIALRTKYLTGWKSSFFPTKILNYSRDITCWLRIYLLLKGYLLLRNYKLLSCELRPAAHHAKIIYLTIIKVPTVKTKYKQNFRSRLEKLQYNKMLLRLYQNKPKLLTNNYLKKSTKGLSYFQYPLMHLSPLIQSEWLKNFQLFLKNKNNKSNFKKQLTNVIKKSIQHRTMLQNKYHHKVRISQRTKIYLKNFCLGGYNLNNKQSYYINLLEEKLKTLSIQLLRTNTIHKNNDKILKMIDKILWKQLPNRLAVRVVQYLPFFTIFQIIKNRIVKSRLRIITLRRRVVNINKLLQSYLLKIKHTQKNRIKKRWNIQKKNILKDLDTWYFRLTLRTKIPSLFYSRAIFNTFYGSNKLFLNNTEHYFIAHEKTLWSLYYLIVLKKKPKWAKIFLWRLFYRNDFKRRYMPQKQYIFWKFYFNKIISRRNTKRHILAPWWSKIKNKKNSNSSVKTMRARKKSPNKIINLLYNMQQKPEIMQSWISPRKRATKKFAIRTTNKKISKYVETLRLKKKILRKEKIQFTETRHHALQYFKLLARYQLKYHLENCLKRYFKINTIIKIFQPFRTYKNFELYKVVRFLRIKRATKINLGIVTIKNLFKNKNKLHAIDEVFTPVVKPTLYSMMHIQNKRFTVKFGKVQKTLFNKNIVSLTPAKENNKEKKMIQRELQKSLLNTIISSPMVKRLLPVLSMFSTYLEPQLLADQLAYELEKTPKHSLVFSNLQIALGALKLGKILGYRISIHGKFNSAQRTQIRYIARGKIPFNCYNQRVTYALAHSRARTGTFGISVWIYS